MYIESKFHDYYDTVRSFGIDKTCIYKRMNEVVPIANRDFLPRGSWDSSNGDLPNLPPEVRGKSDRIEIIFNGGLVAFCGAIYPYIHAHRGYDFSQGRREHIPEDEYFFSEQAYTEYMQEHRATINSGYSSFRHKEYALDAVKGVEGFFSYDWIKFSRYFHEFKIPCFVIRQLEHKDALQTKESYVIEKNPVLKQYKFMRVKDSATAFQEIFMFISGTLGTPARPMVDIEDKYKQQQHGHDHRYSFRREPTKRKPK